MDVTMPDGTIVTDVPEGITKSQLLAKYSKAFNTETPSNPNAIQPGSSQAAAMSHPAPVGYNDGIQRVGPTPEGMMPMSSREMVDAQAEQIAARTGHDVRGAWIDRPETQQAARGPLMGGALALATGGSSAPFTIGRLGLESLGQGGMAAASEAINQREQGVSDPSAIAEQAAMVGAGNFAAPVVMKGAANLVKKIFSTPLDADVSRAAQYARDQGAKFPLYSAIPGSPAGRMQSATNLFLPAQLKNISDAKQVAVFLNQNIGTLTKDPNVIKAAADSGQKFLRGVFEPGETAYTQTFKNFRELVGDDTPIQLTKSVDTIRNAANALSARGEKGPITTRLMEIAGIDPKADEAVSKLTAKIAEARAKLKVLSAKAETGGNKPVIDAQMELWEGKIAEAKRQIVEKTASKGTASLTAKQADELYTGLLRDVGRQGTATGEMGAVLKSLESDLDTVGKAYGANFAEDAASMKASRDKWRELRKVPGLERLSKEMGTGDGARSASEWLDGLFVNPNGKALAKFRELEPQIYHDVADAWLGKNVAKFSRPAQNSIGNVLDGNAFRTWFEANKDRIKVVLGSDQTTALDNFSLYAKYMVNAAQKADQPKMGFGQMVSRMMAETGAVTGVNIAAAPFAIAGAPMIAIPSELSAFALARGLSDPSSALFKVFTKGFDPSTRNFMLMTGQLGGRESARN